MFLELVLLLQGWQGCYPKELEILVNVCVWILVKCTPDQKLIGNLESKK